MSLPMYPVYKDSGVEWLRDLPAHWKVRSLKHIVSTPITDGPHETPVFSDVGIPFVSAEAVASGKIDFSKIRAHISLEDHRRYSTKYAPERHDIYMVKSGATTGLTAIVDTDIEFNIWSPLAAIRCDHEVAHSFYVLNFLRSRNFQEAVTLNWSFGTQQNIGMGVLGNLSVAIPPLEEQIAIANFLRRETFKIDGLISEQEKLITLLAEKRQATIYNAVTKGLNQSSSMKDSGVKWLGAVPEHWAVVRIGALFTEVVEDGSDELPLLSVSIHDGVSDKELNDNEMDRKVTRSDDRSKYKAVQPHDLVYNMMRAWQGGFGSVAIHGMVSPAYIVARPTRALLTPFVEQILRTQNAIVEMKRYSRGITDFRLRLYWDEFKIMQVAIPSLEEQSSIMAFIDEETKRIDALVAEATRGICLLKERSSALISAAVTGKIDVRQVVQQEQTTIQEAA